MQVMNQYTRNPPLDAESLDPDPMRELERWIDAAREAGMLEPTAMTLATAGADGIPAARIVLFKGLHENCPTFYTNYASRKGRMLSENPHAALVFWWDQMERQVRIEGRVEKLPREISEAYFASRPRESQLSAAVSRQSRPVASRTELDARMDEAAERIGDGAIPCPEQWGGYRLLPARVEFWQGRHGRAHDRLLYEQANSGWRILRLEP